MQSNNTKTSYWPVMIVSFIPNIAIATLFSYLSDEGDRLSTFIIIIIGIEVIGMLFSFKKAISLWLVHKYVSSKTNPDNYCKFLIENGFPKPDRTYDSAISYFYDIKEDDKYPVEIRIKAAVEHCAITIAPLYAGILFGTRLCSDWDAAIKIFQSKR